MRHLIIALLVTCGIADSDAQRQAPDIIAHRDIPYAATQNPRQTLDLYLPKDRVSAEPLPVICFIHGGAWRAGNKSAGARHLSRFVSSGKYAGVSIAYRLTGEAHWPAQIHDCKAAIRWIRAHAASHGLDASRLAVWGTSAGGHLVAMLGTSGGDATLEGSLGRHTDQDSQVTAVVDFFGPAELLTMNDHPGRMDHDAPGSPESRLVGGPLQQTKTIARQASPVTYVTPGDPPFLIVHGTADPLVPFAQSKTLHERLRAAGVASTLVAVADAGHGNFKDPSLDQKVANFLAKHLAADPAPDATTRDESGE